MKARQKRTLAYKYHPLEGLTEKQRSGLNDVLQGVRKTDCWSWELPILVRDRCWMRLDRVQLNQLKRFLPPNGRDEAPELMHYRMLMAKGIEPHLAEQACWHEFGMRDCQRALQDYWKSQDHPDHGWTAKRYRQLVSLYRDRIENGSTAVPMLVLARRKTAEEHEIYWITESTTAKYFSSIKK